jgi:hypothetical protein
MPPPSKRLELPVALAAMKRLAAPELLLVAVASTPPPSEAVFPETLSPEI